MLRQAARVVISFGNLLISIPVVLVMLPLWLLPWRTAAALGRIYGRIGYLAWGEGRRAGMINLRRAYGAEVTREQAARDVRTVFENMAQSIVESMQFVRRYRGSAKWETICRVENPELAKKILSETRPKLFVTGHLGSWEIAIQILQSTIGGGAGIARRVDNPWLDWLVKKVRLDHPSQWIEKRGAAGEALARMRNGENIVMLLDENGGSRGPFVDFFGRPASTRKTAAVLALANGSPIVVGAVVRTPGDSMPFLYRVAWIDPVEERLQSPGDIVPITARITSILEGWIRETPLQWRWIHWRWRTRPDGSRERYGRQELTAAFSDH